MAEPEVKLEYSSREVAPAKLLLKQLLKAHTIFLLHHGSSLADVWQRHTRDKFCSSLRRFWDTFLSGWDVLLHGNPAADMYNGIKLSAGGELGIGVGEEAWGSGEREVLEGFVERTEGLVDIVVSRYDNIQAADSIDQDRVQDLGFESIQAPLGGVIFSGLNNIARESIRAVSAWGELIAKQGLRAYGVQDNPNSARINRRPRDQKAEGGADYRASTSKSNNVARNDIANIPAPIVRSKQGSKQLPAQVAEHSANGSAHRLSGGATTAAVENDQASMSDEMMKYLTLGIYGSSWGIPAGRPAPKTASNLGDAIASNDSKRSKRAKIPHASKSSRYLIGLLGDLEDEHGSEDDTDAQQEDSNWRISMRHLFVRRKAPAEYHSSLAWEVDDLGGADDFTERVRTVVYVQQPFIFIFLFDAQTSSLALPLFYRSIHHQLGPLKGPLMKSTDPARLSDRLRDTMAERGATPSESVSAGQSLVYDPIRLTTHHSIPDIPDASPIGSDSLRSWSRLEALSVHSQILNTHVSTRRLLAERELTSKTSRGWWVVWMRLPPSGEERQIHHGHHREAILIRKANDYVAPKSRQTSSALSFGFGRRENTSTKGSKVMDGIGSDVKQYIEALVSLSR